MERLTKRLECGLVVPLACVTGKGYDVTRVIQDMAEQLAAYEDTGLTPDDITTMANDIETRFICYIEREYGQAAGELLRIGEAAREGRVIILPAPAKEGDPKPDCFYNDNWTSLWCQGMAPADGDEPTERCKQCWYCENGYAAEEGDR